MPEPKSQPTSFGEWAVLILEHDDGEKVELLEVLGRDVELEPIPKKRPRLANPKPGSQSSSMV